MTAVLWAVVALPAVAGGLLLLTRPWSDRVAAAASVAVAVLLLAGGVAVAIGRPAVEVPFLAVGGFGLAVDGLAAMVVVAVAAVSLLVLVFAGADVREAQGRFHGLMLLFVAAVMVTATATTLVTLLLGWEVMGAASYALIAFHWRDDRSVGSGTTAFLTTRAADVGLYVAGGAAVAGAALSGRAPASWLDLDAWDSLPSPWLHVVAAGVLVAALGKAAQLPFSFWLSRAMDGPSPVSALLHSAAMVAMGGYLLLRLHPVLEASGWAAPTAAWVGATTTVALGAVAVGQRDLKQLLAASTSAQLGFVVLGAGTAGVAGGTAHLLAHAATKALLFLAAGAWLATLGTRQLPELVGAGRRLPVVGVTFAVGALALAGVPPLSLWATKDEVLAAARESSPALYVVGMAGALLSAAYAGRALGVVLRRPQRGVAGGHDGVGAGAGLRERLPLVLLACGAAVLGVLALPPVGDLVRAAVAPEAGGPEPSASPTELLLSGVLAAVTAALAAAAALPLRPGAWSLRWLGLEAAAHAVIVRPTLGLARWLARFDDGVIAGAVRASPRVTVGVARTLARVDDRGIAAAVEGLGRGARRLGSWARRPQTGLVHQYYAQAAVTLLAAVLLLLLR